MATNVLAVIRQHPHLHGNLKFTALEIGHRMNKSGYVRMAHQMMAWKTGYCLRTAYRHAARLVGMRIFQKTVYRTPTGNAINLYKCLLPIPAFYRASPATTHSDSVSGTLPDPKAEEAKELSLREEIAQLRKGMRWWTEGSEQHTACLEKIQALEAVCGDGRGSGYAGGR